jgi:hypothetical protein
MAIPKCLVAALASARTKAALRRFVRQIAQTSGVVHTNLKFDGFYRGLNASIVLGSLAPLLPLPFSLLFLSLNLSYLQAV